MKRTWLLCLCALAVPQLFADSGQRLIPAGSLVTCTTGGARISSKTTAIGDPVLCKIEHRRGDFMFPYNSYLGGEFSEFKDPGHLVGKGWMELDFDRLYVGNTAIPVDAKVVDVPGYKIDSQGRIQGKGHAVRDTITWMIPILWPIDLIELPRRGPWPTLKAETAMTLRVMEDIQIPETPEPTRDSHGLMERSSNDDAPAPEPAPEMAYTPAPQPAPPVMAYAPPPPPAYYYAPVVYAPYPPVVLYGPVAVRPMYPAAYVQGYYGARPAVAYGPRVLYGYPGAVRAVYRVR
jgi:hypothetical protein